MTGSASLQPDSLFFNFSVYLSALISVICMRSDSTDNILTSIICIIAEIARTCGKRRAVRCDTETVVLLFRHSARLECRICLLVHKYSAVAQIESIQHKRLENSRCDYRSVLRYTVMCRKTMTQQKQLFALYAEAGRSLCNHILTYRKVSEQLPLDGIRGCAHIVGVKFCELSDIVQRDSSQQQLGIERIIDIEHSLGSTHHTIDMKHQTAAMVMMHALRRAPAQQRILMLLVNGNADTRNGRALLRCKLAESVEYMLIHILLAQRRMAHKIIR